MRDGKGAVERREPLVHSSLPIVPSTFSFSPLPSIPTSQSTPLGKVVNTEWLLKSFSSSPGPLYQNEVKCSAFDREMIFIAMQVKLIFTRKVLHLASFWKWGVLELRRQCPIRMTVKMICQLRLLDWKPDRCGAVTQEWGRGRGLAIPPPTMSMISGYLYGKQRERPKRLFPCPPIVFTQQLEILVLTLSATNYYSYLKE